jgi:hypothetical protein
MILAFCLHLPLFNILFMNIREVIRRWSGVIAIAISITVFPAGLDAIMAGDSDYSSSDNPTTRITTAFSGVGTVNGCTCTALDTSSIVSNGTGTWVLTAAHVVKTLADNGTSYTVTFYVGNTSYTYSSDDCEIYYNSSYNSSTGDCDVALIYIKSGISSSITTYSLYTGSLVSLYQKDVTFVGYGYSGYGDVGMSTSYGKTFRSGGNTVDWISTLSNTSGDTTTCYFLIYDFDDPDTGNGLGNDVETTFCTGDSGGPAFYYDEATGKYYIAGVNTLVSSSDDMGKFGTYAYSIAVASVYDWISETITTYSVPEPSDYAVLVGLGALMPLALRRRQRSSLR